MNDTIQFTDGDMYVAMKKSLNESLNIDEMMVEAIENADEKEVAKWNGAIIDYNGLDVMNLKNPVFGK